MMGLGIMICSAYSLTSCMWYYAHPRLPVQCPTKQRCSSSASTISLFEMAWPTKGCFKKRTQSTRYDKIIQEVSWSFVHERLTLKLISEYNKKNRVQRLPGAVWNGMVHKRMIQEEKAKHKVWKYELRGVVICSPKRLTLKLTSECDRGNRA